MELKDYTLVKKLNSGGNGLTSIVKDASGTHYCMKEFRYGMRKGEEDTIKARALFIREAETLRGLNHPQIPHFLDFFADDSSGEERLYLVMEFVPGDDLDSLVRKQRLTEEQAIGIAKKITPILEYLHGFSPSIIHRDIKPRNIIQTPEKLIKLVDFGSVTDRILRELSLTHTRAGSYEFAAPETHYGQALPASDIYSLGVTLVYLLSGGTDLLQMMNSRHRLDFKGKLNVSKKTENLLWDMTEPDLDKRIANTEELKQRIYSNGVMVSKAYQTTDEVAIHYDDIKAIYNRVFWRRWDLERVLKKFDQIFSGVKSVVNDYGRELVTSPIGITLVHNGSKVQVHSPSDAYQVLPKSKDQKSGLVKVENHFSISDGKVKVDLACYEEPEARMGSYGGYYKEFCVVAKISVDSFTPSNRNEYNQLYKLLHGK